MVEEGPVDSSEVLLRRIHRSNFDGDLPTPIRRCEFEPKPRDTDDLSFYRQKTMSVDQLAKSGRSPGDYYIAAVVVKDLLAIGLTVVPTPGDLPGHVSIPELSYAALRADKIKSKDIQRALAVLASRSIMFKPAEQPRSNALEN
jgi:hypothetical protein